MIINKIDSNNKPSFGALKPLTPSFKDYLPRDIFKNDPEGIDRFYQTAKKLEELQKDNPDCDIELFHGENILGDSCPAASITTKDGYFEISKISTHLQSFNHLSDKDSLIPMLECANQIANNAKVFLAKYGLG